MPHAPERTERWRSVLAETGLCLLLSSSGSPAPTEASRQKFLVCELGHTLTTRFDHMVGEINQAAQASC